MITFERMPIALRHLISALFTLGTVILLALPAMAADGLERNIEQLRSSDDFRVRTQAALALGASGDQRATAPLCQALEDQNRTVRMASATALSRLRKGGQSCVKRRIESEKDDKVLASLVRALERLEGGGGAEPLIGPKTRFFVAIESLSGPSRLNELVRAAFVKGAVARTDVAFAPASHGLDAAAADLKKYPQAYGFSLSPRLNKPTYENGMLSVKMSVAMMTYPENALIGTFSKTVAMSGVSEPNQSAENDLVATVAEESMKQFLQLAPGLAE